MEGMSEIWRDGRVERRKDGEIERTDDKVKALTVTLSDVVVPRSSRSRIYCTSTAVHFLLPITRSAHLPLQPPPPLHLIQSHHCLSLHCLSFHSPLLRRTSHTHTQKAAITAHKDGMLSRDAFKDSQTFKSASSPSSGTLCNGHCLQPFPGNLVSYVLLNP